MRVLKSTAALKPTLAGYASYVNSNGATAAETISGNSINSLFGGTYEVTLPSDYLHILNCICVFRVNKNWKCYDSGTYVLWGATRLTADSWSTIINDFYNQPKPWRPYFYIHNVNTTVTTSGRDSNGQALASTLPTNPYNKTTKKGTDWNNQTGTVTINGTAAVASEDEGSTGVSAEESSSNTVTYDLNLADEILVATGVNGSTRRTYALGGPRLGNATEVRCEIRCGKDHSVFTLVDVLVDYIKTPQHIRLTQELLDLDDDISQIMEFPDYVCQEIINELVHIIMINVADPTFNGHYLISLSVASPAQQQQTASPEA